jgi:hypothetical protein
MITKWVMIGHRGTKRNISGFYTKGISGSPYMVYGLYDRYFSVFIAGRSRIYIQIYSIKVSYPFLTLSNPRFQIDLPLLP